jgi:hypothetical protein
LRLSLSEARLISHWAEAPAGTNEIAKLLLVSPIGRDWEWRVAPDLEEMRDITWFKDRFFAAGDRGILQFSKVMETHLSDWVSWLGWYLSTHPKSAPNEDADGNGRSNLLEYALGSSPLDPSNPQTVRIVIDDDYPYFVLDKPVGRTDVTYQVRNSENVSIPNSQWSAIEIVGDKTVLKGRAPLRARDHPHLFFSLDAQLK